MATVHDFWARVEPNDAGCWAWKGRVDNRGYGVIRVDGSVKRAHRLMVELTTGASIPDGRIVMHHCDNPLCVRPDHLSVATQKDNMADAAMKGRMAAQRVTECRQGHPYDSENTYFNRGSRHCRECMRASNRRRRQQQRASS